MKDAWTFRNPTRLMFGDSAWHNISRSLPEGSVAVICGSSAGRTGILDSLQKHLSHRAVRVFDAVEPEPSQSVVATARQFVEDNAAQIVIAIGGGSAIDVAKVASCIAYTDLELAEVMDRTEPIRKRNLYLMAVPTTAGSGSEVTPFSVLTNPNTGVKQSLPCEFFYPDLAIVAPHFLTSVPKKVIGDSGMDALAHALEALWSIHANPVSDGLAFKAIGLIKNHFLTYYETPSSLGAAAGMATAATLAGMAFSNTFTAACHGISYGISNRFGLSHGAACAMTLSAVADLNESALEEKYQKLLTYLAFPSSRSIGDWVASLRDRIVTIPTLSDLKADIEDFEVIAKSSFQPLLDNNPVELSESKIVELLQSEARRQLNGVPTTF